MALRLVQRLRRRSPSAVFLLFCILLLVLFAKFLALAHETESCADDCPLCQLSQGAWLDISIEDFVYEIALAQPLAVDTPCKSPGTAAADCYNPRAPPA